MIRTKSALGVGLFLLAILSAMPTQAANDVARSPWIIDSVTANPILDGAVRITSLRWVGVTTTGHKLILTDSTGRIFFETTAPAGATEYELPLGMYITRGVKVQQIDSGRAYIGFE